MHIKEKPNDGIGYYYRAECYLKFGEYEKALQDIEQFICMKPKNWRGYYCKGHALLGLD